MMLSIFPELYPALELFDRNQGLLHIPEKL